MIHDGEGNPCRKTEGNIMSPTLAGNNGVFFWSTCSRQYLSRFLGLVPVLHSRAPTLLACHSVVLQLKYGCLWCSPEPPRLPVWWMSRSKSVSTSTLKSFLDSCTMQTRSASGSSVPRPNCAALILSRWDILHHIRHGSAVNKPEKSNFRTSVSRNTHMEELQFPVCSAVVALLNWGFKTQHFFTKALNSQHLTPHWNASDHFSGNTQTALQAFWSCYIGLYVWRIHGCWFTCKCCFNDCRALIAGKSTLPSRIYAGLTHVTLFGYLQLL